MKKYLSFISFNLILTGTSLRLFHFNKPKIHNARNLYNIERKTILDLGSSFQNVTYYQEDDVTVVKKECFSQIKGNGPVIFLPGVDMSGLSVYPSTVRLSETRNSYIILAGYSKDQNIEQLCNRVVEYIVKNDLTDIVLVGESFGGLMAVKLSGTLNKRLSHVLLLNPATSYHRTFWKKNINLGNGNISHILFNHGPSVTHVMGSIHVMSESHPDHVYYYIMSYFMMLFNIIVTDQTLIKRRMNSYMTPSGYDIEKFCKKMRIKTTIVVGKKDKLLPSSKEADILKKLIRHSEVIKLEKATHLFCWSDFDINELI